RKMRHHTSKAQDDSSLNEIGSAEEESRLSSDRVRALRGKRGERLVELFRESLRPRDRLEARLHVRATGRGLGRGPFAPADHAQTELDAPAHARQGSAEVV